MRPDNGEDERQRDRGNTAAEMGADRHQCCSLVVESLVKAHSYYLHVSLSPSTGFGGLRKVFSIAAGNKMRQIRLSLSQDKRRKRRVK